MKYEDWKIVLSYFERDAYMFTFDLKSGYHHIDIYKEHQTYLGFSWSEGNSAIKRFYEFTVLPFGLSTAPHIFTKILKPLEKHWRYQHKSIAIFLDDGWSIEKDFTQSKSNSQEVRSDLIKAGFITMGSPCGNPPK